MSDSSLEVQSGTLHLAKHLLMSLGCIFQCSCHPPLQPCAVTNCLTSLSTGFVLVDLAEAMRLLEKSLSMFIQHQHCPGAHGRRRSYFQGSLQDVDPAISISVLFPDDSPRCSEHLQGEWTTALMGTLTGSQRAATWPNPSYFQACEYFDTRLFSSPLQFYFNQGVSYTVPYTRGNAFLLHKRKTRNWLSSCKYFGHLLTILPKGLMPRI